MFVNHIKHAFVGSICSIEHLSLSVEDKFLQVQSYSLSDTEILCILRHTNLHFLTHPKEMINSISAGEYYTGIVVNFNLLLAEVPCRNSFQTDKGMEIQLNAVFPGQLEVW